MNNVIKKPYFTLHLCDPTKHFSVCVSLDGEPVHKIQNLIKFSKEINYPDLSEKVFENKGDDCENGALLVESKEFKFAKNSNANDTDVALDACFQFRVTKYLIKNSVTFKEKYNEYYASLKGTCESFSIINNTKCNNCHMHPINNSKCPKT